MRGRGLHGYHESFQLGGSKSLFGIGGQAGTAFLSIPGESCALIQDWSVLLEVLRDQLGARITRWDGAVDDYRGEHGVDWAVQQYLADQFNAGGSRPSCKQNGNWIAPDGTGRTFYVGKRENGKVLRVYEKGMQLGSPWHPWVRWELELHNKDREIPWDVLLQPGAYVAGAYPGTAWVHETMSRIRTFRKTQQISYTYLTHYASVAYGALIGYMLHVEGSAENVVAKLRRSGMPARLALPCPVIDDGP